MLYKILMYLGWGLGHLMVTGRLATRVIIVAAASLGTAIVARADDFNSRFFFNNQSSSDAYFDASTYSPSSFLASAYSGTGGLDNAAATAMALGQSAVRQYLFPSLGVDAPDWAKRIEIEVGAQKDLKPNDLRPAYSILTVQPLYQDADKQNTLFIQASELRYSEFSKFRDTTNVGIGYRHLMLDNQMLVGINSFFDNEWTYEHKRYSVGGEVKWAALDFNANIYRRLTDYKTIDVTTDTTERAMSGYDLELRSQVPFLPWAQVGARYYRWRSDIQDDTKGWDYSLSANITQNLSIEAGWMKDNYNSAQAYGKFTFRLARTDRPALFSNEVVSNQIFVQRDMRTYTLDKVRRENRIIVERKGGAVNGTIVIARGS